MREIRRSFWILTLCLVAGPALAGPAFEKALDTAKGPVAIHIVQHASFVMRWNGRTIYVDPVGGAARYAGLGAPDIVLITHAHHDHFDPDTLAGIGAERATLVMPASIDAALPADIGGRRIVLANGQSSDRLGWRVSAVPMYNLPNTPDAHHPKGWGNGYVLELGGKRVYVSGDTEGTPEMRGRKHVDLAFVCMNLPYTMDVTQAADAVADLNPRIVYPYHYRGQDTAEFAHRLKRVNPDVEVRLRDWYPDHDA